MQKIKASYHNGRVGNPSHNDRKFLENISQIPTHIDKSKINNNFYFSIYGDIDTAGDFSEQEKKFYENTFSYAIAKQVEKYLSRGQYQYAKNCNISAKYEGKRTCPEESIYQIGNRETPIPKSVFRDCYSALYKRQVEWSNSHGNPFTILNYAFHEDEKGIVQTNDVCNIHCHERKVWHVKKTDGQGTEYFDFGQEKALEQAGLELPKPNEKMGRFNNRKMVYDAMVRQWWEEIISQKIKELNLDMKVDTEREHRPHLEQADFERYKERQLNSKIQALENTISEKEKQAANVENRKTTAERNLATLQNRINEVTKQADEAEERAAKAQKQAQQEQTALDEIRAKARETEKAVAEEKQRILDGANNEAKEIIADAKIKAQTDAQAIRDAATLEVKANAETAVANEKQRILDNAETYAQNKRTEADSVLATAKTEAASIQATTQTAKNQLATLQIQIAEAKETALKANNAKQKAEEEAAEAKETTNQEKQKAQNAYKGEKERILSEAENKAREILADAKKQSDKIIAEAKADAKADAKEIKQKAESDVQKAAELISENIERNEKIVAKIDRRAKKDNGVYLGGVVLSEPCIKLTPDDYETLKSMAEQQQAAIFARDIAVNERDEALKKAKVEEKERQNAMQIAKQQAEKDLEDEKNALKYRANNLGELGKLPTDALTMLNSIAKETEFIVAYRKQQDNINIIIKQCADKIYNGNKIKQGKLPNKEDPIYQAITKNAKGMAEKLGLPTNSITKSRVQAVLKAEKKQKDYPATTATLGATPTAPPTYEHNPEDTDYSVGLQIPNGTTSDEDADALRDWNFLSDLKKDELRLKKMLREFGL